ncbi:putative threonine dehydratase [Sycon ciliatum]|uniref:putative threonine dehydratase n=1 Tax=Sycon ciliatum TaxID=27933 RepID=UPI0031F70DDC
MSSNKTELTLPTLAGVREARERNAGHVVRTPLVRVPAWSRSSTAEHVENLAADVRGDGKPLEIYLKLENLQHTGCFKARAAFNALLSADSETCRRHGVITASTGNFGQALAWCAQQVGIPCTIVVSNRSAEAKVAKIRQHGASVIRVTYDQWWEMVSNRRFPGHEEKLFMHPSFDLANMEGNGTIALEILEDLPEVDAVLAPFGGGGICTAIGAVMKELRPECKVYPVELETARQVHAAYEAGRPVDCDLTPSFIDCMGGRAVLPEIWPLAQAVSERPLTVSLNDAVRGMQTVALATNSIAEGAAGATAAAALKGLAGAGGGKVVAIVSGGNINLEDLALALHGQVPPVRTAECGES